MLYFFLRFAAFLERHRDVIKECVIHVDTQEKGLIPAADMLGMSQQVIEEAVQSVMTEAPAQTVTIHQQPQAQQQHAQHHHQQPQHIEISGNVSPTTYHQLTVQQQPHQHQALQGHSVQVRNRHTCCGRPLVCTDSICIIYPS